MGCSAGALGPPEVAAPVLCADTQSRYIFLMLAGNLHEKQADKNMQIKKLTGYDFYDKILKGAKKIVAPMVDQSELAWRLMSRRHGAELCYTPMLNAKIFVGHAGYREREFQTHPDDHPLIAQFCGNDPEIIVKAAKMVEDQVEGVDLNLGCPQQIAKKGHYGSYLQDEWNLIRDIVTSMHRNLFVPITVKIRVFDDTEKTLKYAKMIEECGAQVLTVHGRMREQRGTNTGIADWEKIKLIKESANIPVFANGNILFKDDIYRCMEATGADGIMTAEGNLYNPCIFEDRLPAMWDMVDEYLNICKTDAPNTSLTAVRGHLFKLYRPVISDLINHRTLLGEARSFDDICRLADEINNLLKSAYDGTPAPLNHSSTRLPTIKHFCQPYVRDLDLLLKSRPESCSLPKETIRKEPSPSLEPPSKIIKIDSLS